MTALLISVTGVASPMAQERDPHLIRQGELSLPEIDRPYKRPKVDKRLPHAKLVKGRRNVAAVWFSQPSTEYRHDPFGTGEHAKTLMVSTAERRILRLDLPRFSVFEDLVPRLADLDGDGRDEVIVVRSRVHRGASLAVVRVLANALVVAAETPPLGTPFQWLNPAGVGDFDGDGKPEIAIVVTPEEEGELQFWVFHDNRLELVASETDVSNHAPGSARLGLSAVADFDGDGIADLAIPDQQRHTLRFLNMRGGKIRGLGERW
ncbi:MAG: FG-GAP repeat domain-containing protein, partial [Hyphomicrobiaceae bacterium]